MKKIYTFLLALISVTAISAQCMLVEVPLQNRVNVSDLVVEGKVTTKNSYIDANTGMIYTNHVIEVYKVFKGNLTTTSLNIITEGGVVGDRMVVVDPSPEFEVGDVGVFTCSPNHYPVFNASVYPTYNCYANVQGFIHYMKNEGKAVEPFKEYVNVESELYAELSYFSGQAFIPVKNFDVKTFFSKSSIKGGVSVMATPSISDFSPTTITAGTKTNLTINGTNFGATPGNVGFKNADNGGSTYRNPLASQIISWSNTQIVVEVPAKAGTGTIQVTNSSAETGTSAGTLTISYNRLNVNYTHPTVSTAFKTHHFGQNGSGGYTWQMNTAFDGNASAKASFLRAFDTWRCGTGVNWTLGSTTAVAVHSTSDNVNVITFDSPSDPLDAGVLGTCYSSFGGCFDGDDMDWYVDDLDIVFDDGSNLGVRTWCYSGVPTSNEYDFETVAVHELGHGHQLGHVISPGAIMHYSITNGTSNRSLGVNDQAGGDAVQAESTAPNACAVAVMTNYSCGTPPTANFTSNKTQVCVGGTVSFTDQSTQSPTSWSWSFSGGTPSTSTSQNPTITYSTAGTYNVTLTATNGDGSDGETKTGYITVNANPTAARSITNVTCNGTATGAITSSNSGGTAPYTYSWSNGASTQNISNVVAGSYTFTLTDNKGCSGTTSATVTQPNTLVTTLTPIDATCNSNNGSVSSSVSGGTPAYTYLWNNGVTAATANSLAFGTYTLTVTDNKGCKTINTATVASGCAGSTTRLTDAYCGAVLASMNTTIAANVVTGALYYDFEITNAGLGFTKNLVGSSSVNLSNRGLQYGQTYNVRVRVYIGGAWGSYGVVCTITTPAFPTTQLAAGSCNATLSSLTQTITCNTVADATYYEFEITNGGLGFSKTLVGSASMPLNNNVGLQYAQTYNVRVRSYVNGAWSSYGSICTITTPAFPATQIVPALCGATMTSLSQAISCNSVTGAYYYEFLFVHAGTGYSRSFVGGPSINIGNATSGIRYGLTYTVSVRAFVNGAWSGYGSQCAITTPALPTTQLSTGYCNSSVSSSNQWIYCDAVTSATYYRFRLVNIGLGFSYEYIQPSQPANAFKLSKVPGILPNTTYTVEVSYYLPSSGTWSSYGPMCNITTTGGYNLVIANNNGTNASIVAQSNSVSQITNVDFDLYPNPVSSGDKLNISVPDVEGSSISGVVKIFDILGNELLMMNIITGETRKIQLPAEITSGIYFVRTQFNDQVLTKRFVIK